MSKEPFTVTNTEARMISIAGQDIMPGATSRPIPDNMIDAVKKSPAFRAGWLKEGKVQMPPPKLPPLDKATPEQAAKLISTETNLEILKAWIDAEKRPGVLAMLSERVKQL